MSLAPLTPLRPRSGGTPTCTSVREAGGGGQWITLHAADSDEGTVHVFIGGNGRVTKGPSSLVGSAIGHLASHPSVKSAEHHPPGHEPAGAKSHPRYAEHQPAEKPAPLPGKPYARLHGGAQTRQEQPEEGPEPLSEEQTHAGLQTAREQAKAATSASPEAKAADAAVAHQQAQAELAQYRASKDRNPNPWAPHLSPPVDDAKDRELQEKATRAQLAHQAVQAQQQQAAQAQQQEGQRAHDKEMVRLKASTTTAAQKPAIKPLQAPPTPPATDKPSEITKEHIQAKVAAGEHLTREEKGFVLNGYRMPKPKPEDTAQPATPTERPKAAAAPERDAERAAHDTHHRATLAHFDAGGTFNRAGEPRGGTRQTRDAVRSALEDLRAAGTRAALAEIEEDRKRKGWDKPTQARESAGPAPHFVAPAPTAAR